MINILTCHKKVWEGVKKQHKLNVSERQSVALDGPPRRLNPIENWFAKLQRHVIKYGDFSTVEEVCSKISRYIHFYNDCLAKPMKWKFKGFSKNTPFKFLSTIT